MNSLPSSAGVVCVAPLRGVPHRHTHRAAGVVKYCCHTPRSRFFSHLRGFCRPVWRCGRPPRTTPPIHDCDVSNLRSAIFEGRSA
jgi:hypothetical protein